VLRARTLRLLFGSVAVMAGYATPALAETTGGVVAVGTGKGGPSRSTSTASGAGATPTSAATPAPIHASPITARTPRLAYKGPVFQKTASGEVIPFTTAATAAQVSDTTGGSAVEAAANTTPQLLVPGSLARYVDGLAAAPMSAPVAVQEVIWAGNQIIGLPYIYGGGHASFQSPGYDCSGTVSFALHGGSLLATPEDSSEFMVWGSHGVGRWITIFSNPSHAYVDVAGLRLDTSGADDPSNQQGPRWRPLRPGNGGFTIRHPRGL
jgi:cell wall-associated NlpC family hydrolase